jgi:hypothetical protein
MRKVGKYVLRLLFIYPWVREITSVMYKDFLTKEELEALLSPEELDAFKTEQHSRLDHELMLSPAHLLLAIRELEDIVMRLTQRVEYLEGHGAQHQTESALEPVYVQNQTEAAPEPVYQQDNEVDSEPGYELDAASNESIPDLHELITQTMPELLPEATPETIIESTPKIENGQAISVPPSSLISRAERHRERKPSLLSKLLK